MSGRRLGSADHERSGGVDEAAKELGKGALVLQADVSKLADADKLFSAVEKRFGKIDVLFVNA